QKIQSFRGEQAEVWTKVGRFQRAEFEYRPIRLPVPAFPAHVPFGRAVPNSVVADLLQGNDEQQGPEIASVGDFVKAAANLVEETAEDRLDYVFGVESRCQVWASVNVDEAKQTPRIALVEPVRRPLIPRS